MINIINAKQFNWCQIPVLECADGTYGYNCTKICSGHCLNNSPCNKQNGYCDKGCNPGYTNVDCSKSKLTNECNI